MERPIKDPRPNITTAVVEKDGKLNLQDQIHFNLYIARDYHRCIIFTDWHTHKVTLRYVTIPHRSPILREYTVGHGWGILSLFGHKLDTLVHPIRLYVFYKMFHAFFYPTGLFPGSVGVYINRHCDKPMYYWARVLAEPRWINFGPGFIFATPRGHQPTTDHYLLMIPCWFHWKHHYRKSYEENTVAAKQRIIMPHL